MRRILRFVCSVIVMGLPVAAHANSDGSISGTSMRSEMRAKPVVGEPYSATKYETDVRTLADGTTVTKTGHHTVARDSDGRLRIEHPCGCVVPNTTVIVIDPVAHTMMTWTTNPKGAKIATVMKLPQPRTDEVVPASMPQSSGRPDPLVTTEELPQQTMDGVPVTGLRTTTVIPAGRAGNDAPITKSKDVWISADLKLVIREVVNDPRLGVITTGLKDLTRAQPDPALFHPPAGYQIKDAIQSMKEMADKLAAAEN